MARAKTSERTYARLWKRFDDLATTTDAERHSAYQADGMQFLAQLISKTLRDYDVPAIESAEAFSEFIVTLRANYRTWNQHLMSVMIKSDGLNEADHLADLADIQAKCPWKALVDTAHNFTLSRSI